MTDNGNQHWIPRDPRMEKRLVELLARMVRNVLAEERDRGRLETEATSGASDTERPSSNLPTRDGNLAAAPDEGQDSPNGYCGEPPATAMD